MKTQALIATLLTGILITGNTLVVMASENSDPIQVTLASGKEETNTSYSSSNNLNNNIDDFLNADGAQISYEDYTQIDPDSLNEIIDNGTTVIVKVSNEQEEKQVAEENNASDSTSNDNEISTGVVLSNENGKTVVGYVGYCIFDDEGSESAAEEEKGEETSTSEMESIDTSSVTKEFENISLKAPDIKESDIKDTTSETEEGTETDAVELQLPSGYDRDPVTKSVTCYTSVLKKKMGIVKVTQYMYYGYKYKTSSGTKKTVDIAISSIKACPTSGYAISPLKGYQGKMGTGTKTNMQILDETYLNSDTSKTVSLGVGGSGSADGISGSANYSVSYSYTSSSLNIDNNFSDTNEDTWYVYPAKRAYGDAKCITPGLVVRNNDSSNRNTYVFSDIRNVCFVGNILHTVSGTVAKVSDSYSR